MAGNNAFNSNNFKDSMDINELASLNDDISPELIEQLQQKLEEENKQFNENDDTTLFEEPSDPQENAETPEQEKKAPKKSFQLDKNFDDNFIKKYKAKINKQKQEESTNVNAEAIESISNDAFMDITPSVPQSDEIEQISQGNITEKAITNEQKNYNDSLDFLDGNIKYSKYVIYIDPQNVEFIDSLTVKERKNLINKILREQDDIAITKQRFSVINTVIKHAIISIITITISIPIIYWAINTSLEATINNYRHSQSIFQTLYKEKGKISVKK